MLKVLLRLVLVLLVLGGILALVGSLLPHDFDVRTVRQVNAPPAAIFPVISDLRRWSEWTAWDDKGKPWLKIQFGPDTEGAGASQTWTDPRGSGKLWLTGTVLNESIEYQTRFGRFPEITNRISLQPNQSGTEVVWTSSGRLPSGPFYGFFRGFFCEGLRREYDSSLEKLEKSLQTPK